VRDPLFYAQVPPATEGKAVLSGVSATVLFEIVPLICLEIPFSSFSPGVSLCSGP